MVITFGNRYIVPYFYATKLQFYTEMGLLVKMGDENSWNAFIYLPLHHLLFI
jgi:hypothetical protein